MLATTEVWTLELRKWVATGDVASFDHAQRIIVHGRSNRRVKRDGMWIDLSDVESSLVSLYPIQEAAVVSGIRTARGVEIVAFCTIRAGVEISCEEVKACVSNDVKEISARSDTNRESTPQASKRKIDRSCLQEEARELMREAAP